MTLTFTGTATFKSRNRGWLSFLDRTVKRDFTESLGLGDRDPHVERTLPAPFPAVIYADYDQGRVSAGIKVLGIAKIPLFHRELVKPGQSIPVRWSAAGCSLVGTVSVR